MAAMTTAALVGMYEPGELAEEPRGVAGPTTFQARLGLAHDVGRLNAFALLSTAFLTICWLVFLNSGQVFVLSDLLGVGKERIGSITGSLILADELLSLVAVFVWGACCDVFGVRWIAVGGHVTVALSFVAYVLVGSTTQLLGARLLFAVGGSALVTTLSAALASFTAIPSSSRQTPAEAIAARSREGTPNERSALLAADDSTYTPPDPAHAAQFAGLVGFSTGCGALLAVFGFLRLPTHLAEWFPIGAPFESLQRGLRWTFFLVALVAILEAMFLVVGLKRRSTSRVAAGESEKVLLGERLKEVVNDLPVGFVMAWRQSEVSLAYASGFATRAQSLVCSAFLPVLINNFFINSGLCDIDSPPSLFSSEAQGCRRAFILSSSLTGSIQLISLLCSPLIGYLSSNYSQPLILSLTCSFGALAFTGFAFLPGGDPRSGIAWLWAAFAGISQIGGIVVSLALVARTRGEAVAREGREVGGAISGAYSACGGLGVLIIGKLGGTLLDRWVGAPFLMIAGVNALTASFAMTVYVQHRRKAE